MSKRILFTGATGKMGYASLIELIDRKNDIEVTILARKSKKNVKKMKKFNTYSFIKIIWGDLCDYDSVKNAVRNIDIIIHMGALVSPMADKYPDLAWKINFEGSKNIIDAISDLHLEDKIEFVYIGTVAETGNRPFPYHWGRIGDPISPSKGDYYAISKIAAERYVIESKIKKWISLRQTGIIHEDILKMRDGIEFHQPLDNHMEWVSLKDTANLIANICEYNIDKEVWRKVYNIGGGNDYRMTSYKFMKKIFGLMKLDMQNVYSPNMFALKNFHGHYFLDSDELNDIFNFRVENIEECFKKIYEQIPISLKVIKFLPPKLIKFIMKKQSECNKKTPLCWMKNQSRYETEVKNFIGSKDEFNQINDWDIISSKENKETKKFVLLNHGYDEEKCDCDLDLEDMKMAAEFRGGQCISSFMLKGDLYSKLEWKCSEGHEFSASPYLVLKAGHWCDECLINMQKNKIDIVSNKFFTQIL